MTRLIVFPQVAGSRAITLPSEVQVESTLVQSLVFWRSEALSLVRSSSMPIFEPFRARRLEMTSFLVRYETNFTMIGRGFVWLFRVLLLSGPFEILFSLRDPTRCDLSMSFFVIGIFRISFTTRHT